MSEVKAHCLVTTHFNGSYRGSLVLKRSLPQANTTGTPRAHMIQQEVARCLNWKFTLIPSPMFHAVRALEAVRYHLFTKPFTSEGELPGSPRHLWMNVPRYTQNFDNTRARTVLGFEPRLTWKEAVAGAVEDYKASEHYTRVES